MQKIIIIAALMLVNIGLCAQQSSVLPIPQRKNLLFFLQRTPNSNTVIYEINFKKDGTINQNEPVVGSWIRYEEQEKYKPLTSLEQKFTYGLKCKSLGVNAFEIRLVAYQKMPLYLLKRNEEDTYKMYIKNDKEYRLLKRVFVKVNGGSFWFPKIKYIDLITIHSKTGQEIINRIAV